MMTPEAIKHSFDRLDNQGQHLFMALLGKTKASHADKYVAIGAVNDENLAEGEQPMIQNRKLFEAVRRAVKLAAEAEPEVVTRTLKGWAMDLAMMGNEP
jgi:hypothetical protein